MLRRWLPSLYTRGPLEMSRTIRVGWVCISPHVEVRTVNACELPPMGPTKNRNLCVTARMMVACPLHTRALEMSRTIRGRTFCLIRTLQNPSAKNIRTQRAVALKRSMCYAANCTVWDGVRLVMNVAEVLSKCSMCDTIRGDTHLLKHSKLAVNGWQRRTSYRNRKYVVKCSHLDVFGIYTKYPRQPAS